MPSKKYNVFLDLDHTIICSEEYNPTFDKYLINYDHDFLPPYVTCARPNLQKFLDFLFTNFNVCIWTAASKNYASFILQRFILSYNKNRVVKLLLHKEHCDISFRQTGSTKNLSILNKLWNIPGFTQENTIILDDLKEVFQTQPKNCILLKPFKIKNGQHDFELCKVANILKLKYK